MLGKPNALAEYDLRNQRHCVLGSHAEIGYYFINKWLVSLIDFVDLPQYLICEVVVIQFLVDQ